MADKKIYELNPVNDIGGNTMFELMFSMIILFGGMIALPAIYVIVERFLRRQERKPKRKPGRGA